MVQRNNIEILKPAWQEEIKVDDKITTVETSKGEFLNLDLKPNKRKGVTGLAPGEFMTLTKGSKNKEAYVQDGQSTGADGKSFSWKMHKCAVAHEKGHEGEVQFVTFDEEEGLAFNEVCGMDEQFQVSCEKIGFVDGKGAERMGDRLVFRKVK